MSTTFRRLLFITAILAASCSGKKPPVPFNTFKNVLKELHLSEAAAGVPGTSFYESFATDSSARFNAMVLKKNGISEAQFREALGWYKDRPELLDSVYRLVLNDLTLMQSDINK